MHYWRDHDLQFIDLLRFWLVDFLFFLIWALVIPCGRVISRGQYIFTFCLLFRNLLLFGFWVFLTRPELDFVCEVAYELRNAKELGAQAKGNIFVFLLSFHFLLDLLGHHR